MHLGLAVAAALLSVGCAHGRFVGTAFAPTKLYDGPERPEAELATIYWGEIGQHDGKALIAPVLGVDGVDCGKVNSVLSAIPNVTRCTQVVQVAAGVHSVTGYVRTLDTFTADGKKEWRESTPTTIEGQELRAGYVYKLVPEPGAAPPTIKLLELCKSSDHIATVKSDGVRCANP